MWIWTYPKNISNNIANKATFVGIGPKIIVINIGNNDMYNIKIGSIYFPIISYVSKIYDQFHNKTLTILF